MTNARTATFGFNFGAISKEASATLEAEFYSRSCLELENFIITRVGAIRKRPPFTKVLSVQSTESIKLIPWAPNSQNTLAIAFTPGLTYIENGEVLDNPYTEQDIDNLQYIANSSDLVITTGYSTPYVFKIQNDAFAFNPINFRFGATRDQNIDQTITISASATTGTVTLTASKDLFKDNMEGGIWALTEPAGNLARYTQWAVSQSISINNYRRNDDKLYIATTSGVTGNIPPTHDIDDEIISDGAVSWKFLNFGIGYARIESITSTTQAIALVQRWLPPTVATGASGFAPTWRWNEGAWSKYRGFPRSATFFNNSLYFGGIQTELETEDPLASFKAGTQRYWISVQGDLSSFDTNKGSRAEDLSSDRSTPIVWLKSTDRLIVGTEQGIFQLDATELKPSRSVSDSAAPIQAQLLDNALIFVTFSRSTIRAARYDDNAQSYTTEELGHLTREFLEGTKDLAIAQAPDQLIVTLNEKGYVTVHHVAFSQSLIGLYLIKNDNFLIKAITILSKPDGDYLYAILQTDEDTVLASIPLGRPYIDTNGTAIDLGKYNYTARVKLHRVAWLPLTQNGLPSGYFDKFLTLQSVKIDVMDTQDISIDGNKHTIRTHAMKYGEYPEPTTTIIDASNTQNSSPIIESTEPLTCNIRAVEVKFVIPDRS